MTPAVRHTLSTLTLLSPLDRSLLARTCLAAAERLHPSIVRPSNVSTWPAFCQVSNVTHANQRLRNLYQGRTPVHTAVCRSDRVPNPGGDRASTSPTSGPDTPSRLVPGSRCFALVTDSSILLVATTTHKTSPQAHAHAFLRSSRVDQMGCQPYSVERGPLSLVGDQVVFGGERLLQPRPFVRRFIAIPSPMAAAYLLSKTLKTVHDFRIMISHVRIGADI